MGEFLSAGVFTEEVQSGETAILGVSTSNFASVGWLPRGEENKAILCTSLTDYFRKFGTYWKYSDLPLNVTAFFKNDGARAYIVRVTPADALYAQVTVATNLWLIKAISKGAWGNLVRAQITGNQNNYNHATATYSKFDIDILEESVDGTGDFSVVETFEAVDLSDPDSADYFTTTLNDEENGSNEVRITKLTGGVPTAFNPTPVLNESVGTGNGSQQTFVKTLAQPEAAPFTVSVKVDGTVIAVDDGRGHLGLATGASGYSVSGTVDYDGDLSIYFAPAPAGSLAISVDYVKKGADSVAYDLVGGADGTAVTRAQVSDPVLEATLGGLYALNKVDEILNIGIPDFSGDIAVQGDVIAYCANRKDCFGILDTRRGIDAQDAKNYKQVTLASQSSYAAIYWPGIKVADPLKNGKPKTISPIGHIAGVYARTDTTRNVGKAPAGVVDGQLNFALGIEFDLVSKGERDTVYPVNVNPLIATPQTGKAVWGARTLATTGDFTLINVRRLFIFLEKSTFNATHDLVFEPLGDDLFATTKLRMDAFLNGLTQDGYFASRVPVEAFRVVCDSTNNTPATIAARQLICDILVAAQTPAEFVRFRFQRSINTLS